MLLAGALCAQANAGDKSKDDAAVLYQLALTELERGASSGAIQVPRNPFRGSSDDWAANFAVYEQERREVLEQSALVRSLFAQAATRPRCHLPELPELEYNERERSLATVVRLIEMRSEQRRRQPEIVCGDVFTLLRYVRHRVADGSWAKPERDVFGLPIEPLESRVLKSLHKTLRGVPRDGLFVGLLARCERELASHEAAMPGYDEVIERLVGRVGGVMQQHQPRLRDMHQHEAGGFDLAKMTIQLQVGLRVALTRPVDENVPFKSWLAGVPARLREHLKISDPGATVTDKAMLGLVPLVVGSNDEVARLDYERARWLAKCRAVMAAAAGPQLKRRD